VRLWWAISASSTDLATNSSRSSPSFMPHVSSGMSTETTSFSESMHPGRANFLFGDGSVHFLKQSVNIPVYCFSADRVAAVAGGKGGRAS
jgi:prepilin-type processing-associated H-X9-DG protein